jgi:hypothetical protein
MSKKRQFEDELEGMDGGESGGAPDLDQLMRARRNNLTLVLFIVGLVLVVGFLGYVFFNQDARERVISFVRGDLFHMEKQRIEDLQKLYTEKIEQMQEKYGDIRLEYFPRDARVHVVQTLHRYDDIEDKTPEPWGDPREIDNPSLALKEGEEIPYLNLEGLPVRERGLLCPVDGQFYPASRLYCPGSDECIAAKNAQAKQESKDEEAKEGEAPKEGEATEAAKALDKPKESEECAKKALRPVQFCPQDNLYYVEGAAGVMVCPDGKTQMDLGKAPLFVYRYDFLFERKDFLPQAVSYAENDWMNLGSGKYIIPFPKDFALLRAWGPVKAKYAAAREQMRCWRLAWEDKWEELKRQRVIALVKEKLAEEAKKKEEKAVVAKAKREQYVDAVTAVDIVRKAKNMSTIRNGMGEIFYYCPEVGKCDETRMPELKAVNEDAYYGLLAAMKVPGAKWPGLEEFLAGRPIAKAGLSCVAKWIPIQKEGEFVPMRDKDCLAAIESVKGMNEQAYTALNAMFVEPAAGTALLNTYKTDVENYVMSVDDYQGAEKYEDLVFRMESSGRFLEFAIMATLYDYAALTDAMIKYAKSRQVNYRRDCEKRQVIPSDAFRGMKDALEVAWWTGSKMAFEDWYARLWAMDVQGCLLFVKEYDKARYEQDLKRFADLVGQEKEGLRAQTKGFRDFLVSLRDFQANRAALKEAYALYKKDKAGFFKQYPATDMAALQARSPALYAGILYLSDPAAGKAAFDALAKLPEVPEGVPAKKQGDQPLFHKYMAYMDVFNPTALGDGMKTLAERMEPMYYSEQAWEKLREEKPELPGYREALQDIVNNDVHLKYFWLLLLIESPSKVDREFARLDLKKSLEVAKWVDPQRFVYLSDLVWLKEMVGRYQDAVPMLMDSLTVDINLYNTQFEKLKLWCDTKSRLIKEYRRGRKLADSFLKEPNNVYKALEKGLKQANRFALLAKNLEDFDEAVVSTHMAHAMEELRDTFDLEQRDSYAKHVDTNNDSIRINAGFTKKEWESLTKEFEKTAANAEWYGALSERLANRRLDCDKVNVPTPEGWDKLGKE